MPVTFDSSGHAWTNVGATDTESHVDCKIQVNGSADNLVAIVGMLWIGGVDTSDATFTATFGGTNMTLLATVPYYDNQFRLSVWTLTDPPTGAVTVTVTDSDMPTELLSLRNMSVVAATYWGVDSIGDPVSATDTDDIPATNTNAVTVTSVAPAHRVVSLHSVRAPLIGGLKNYNHTLRARMKLVDNEIGLQDAPGDTSVTMSATQQTTSDWGAVGVSLAPSVVYRDANTVSVMSPEAMSVGSIYRAATPDRSRYWVVPQGSITRST